MLILKENKDKIETNYMVIETLDKTWEGILHITLGLTQFEYFY